jgi:hypothetical protein
MLCNTVGVVSDDLDEITFALCGPFVSTLIFEFACSETLAAADVTNTVVATA